MIDDGCDAKVWDASGWHRHDCTRRGVERVGVGWYCKQHAAIARRRIEREKRHPVNQSRTGAVGVSGD